jgi:D-glycero-alpha-D-manno-heptose 1-phosphate guanylyltransferase
LAGKPASAGRPAGRVDGSLFALILAGGLGTRIRHLLPNLPKPLAPAAGRPFLEWVVRFLARQGCARFGISTGFLAEAIRAHFASAALSGLEIECVPEPEPLGTGGGLRFAAQRLKPRQATWLVCNGDSLCLADIRVCCDELESQDVEGVLVGVPAQDAARYGTLRLDASRRLMGFEEKHPGAGVINAGIYVLRPAVLSRFPSQTPLSLEKEVFPDLLRQGVRLAVSVQDVPFLDIGTEDGLAAAETFVRKHRERFA